MKTTKKVTLTILGAVFSAGMIAQSGNNGLSVVLGNTQLGQACDAPGLAAQLLNNRRIPMNNYNLFFTGQSTSTANAVGIGYNCDVLPAKFSVRQQSIGVAASSWAGSFVNDDVKSGSGGNISALIARSEASQPINVTNTAGDFLASNAITNNTAGRFLATGVGTGTALGIAVRASGGSTNTGVYSAANGGAINFGVRGFADNATITNYGGTFSALSSNNVSAQSNFGIQAVAAKAINSNTGVFSAASGGNNSFAFNGTASGAIVTNHGASVTVSGGQDSYGVEATVTGASNVNVGIRTNVSGGGGSDSYGASFNAIGPNNNFGIRAFGSTGNVAVGIGATASGASILNTGLDASAFGSALNNSGVRASAGGASNNNYGVHTTADPTGVTNSYALYASNVGCSPNHWAGYFQGDVNINGCGAYALTVNGAAFLSSGTLWTTSDKSYKKDIRRLENVTEKLNKLKGYSYYFKTEEFQDKKFDKTEQIGLIAQELKEVFPQLVTTDEKGFMAVNYQGMIPVLLEAIKEQHQQIEELKTLVKGSSDNNNLTTKTVSSVTLNDAQAIVLEQNVPNPFAEQTSITYNLTEGVQKAQILFYNADGKLINTSELRVKAGQGQLNVFASDLSNGVYTYTLVVDGKVIESKRMIKTK